MVPNFNDHNGGESFLAEDAEVFIPMFELGTASGEIATITNAMNLEVHTAHLTNNGIPCIEEVFAHAFTYEEIITEVHVTAGIRISIIASVIHIPT